MAIRINKITNANIYVNGGSFLGSASEVDLPEIVQKMAEHVALGLIGTPEMPSGIESMEATIRWNSKYEEAVKLFANPYGTLDIQIRANVEVWEAGARVSQVPYVAYIRGTSKTHQAGNFRQHENVETENALSVFYIKEELNGVELLELDVTANIYRVNGVDIVADFKNNIGS